MSTIGPGFRVRSLRVVLERQVIKKRPVRTSANLTTGGHCYCDPLARPIPPRRLLVALAHSEWRGAAMDVMSTWAQKCLANPADQ